MRSLPSNQKKAVLLVAAAAGVAAAYGYYRYRQTQGKQPCETKKARSPIPRRGVSVALLLATYQRWEAAGPLAAVATTDARFGQARHRQPEVLLRGAAGPVAGPERPGRRGDRHQREGYRPYCADPLPLEEPAAHDSLMVLVGDFLNAGYGSDVGDLLVPNRGEGFSRRSLERFSFYHGVVMPNRFQPGAGLQKAGPSALVEGQGGGAHETNKAVLAQMRAWLARVGRDALKAREGKTDQGTLALTNQMGRLLHEQGELREQRNFSSIAWTHARRLSSQPPGYGKLAEAEPLCCRALQAREKTLGAEHEDTLTSFNNLASLLLGQGKLAEAEPLCRRAPPPVPLPWPPLFA
eukprot:g33403.t1